MIYMLVRMRRPGQVRAPAQGHCVEGAAPTQAWPGIGFILAILTENLNNING
jgi:hypothetical protein